MSVAAPTARSSAVRLPLRARVLGARRPPPLLLGLGVLVAVLVVVRHRSNIQRLLNGTENRIQFKKKEATP